MGNAQANRMVFKLRSADSTRIHLFIVSESVIQRLNRDKILWKLYPGIWMV